jgi:hypothetical protein
MDDLGFSIFNSKHLQHNILASGSIYILILIAIIFRRQGELGNDLFETYMSLDYMKCNSAKSSLVKPFVEFKAINMVVNSS